MYTRPLLGESPPTIAPGEPHCQCPQPALAQPSGMLDRSATLGDLATLIGVLSAVLYLTQRKG